MYFFFKFLKFSLQLYFLKIVTTSTQREVRIWSFDFENVGDSRNRAGLAVNFIANLEGHRGPVNIARFSPNGTNIY